MKFKILFDGDVGSKENEANILSELIAGFQVDHQSWQGYALIAIYYTLIIYIYHLITRRS